MPHPSDKLLRLLENRVSKKSIATILIDSTKKIKKTLLKNSININKIKTNVDIRKK